jgi:hypothetical protein
MRTLLAALSLVMLVGAGVGCGDDSTTTTGADMAVGLDMTAAAHDMSQLNCGQILSCSRTCTTLACAQQCIAEGKTTSQQIAGGLLQCAGAACAGGDGGVDTTCATNVVLAAVSGGGSGPCKAEGQACVNDM